MGCFLALALRVGKNGPKLPDRSAGVKGGDEAAGRAAFATPHSPGEKVTWAIEKMQSFIDALNGPGPSREMDRPVLDKTGLKGTYVFNLHWGAEDFKTAVEETCGLKFVPQKAPIEILVVDRIEKPDAN
jgi:uncharacterized protein (TIGR03435 family)